MRWFMLIQLKEHNHVILPVMLQLAGAWNFSAESLLMVCCLCWSLAEKYVDDADDDAKDDAFDEMDDEFFDDSM